MAEDDDDYVEVDAVVRMPRDKNLADSKKSEGWSRGYTPRSSERGPEHVEIRLKGPVERGDTTPVEPQPDPQIAFVSQYDDTRHKTRAQEDAEELAQLLVKLALLRAAEWAQPRIKRLWTERVIPFFEVKREQRQQRKALRRAADLVADDEAAPDAGSEIIPVVPAAADDRAGEQAAEVGDALVAYTANMTSQEARAHFVQLLIAQHLVNEKTRLLANARIEEHSVAPELASAMRALTPRQVANALETILASRPNLLGDLGKLIDAQRGPFSHELGTSVMKEAVRLTEDDT